ncbi:DUF2793 domain-containing protein [Erythrobacter tepidarius]|uniref:DUF2793 domain-containing protein n=1 Tax=Erythrobacter tepidarius TaxID=60454 RepID=UPI000A360998|nr:DUF2793 domain-containing protein [Erythrobacter tepidarius]
MSDPIVFPAGTPNARLPLLFAGQAQKEFFVNQSLAILDALVPRTVIATLAEPPALPAEGGCYLVAQEAAGAWSGRADQLALSIGGSWHFIAPDEGMLMFDQNAGIWLCFRNGWQGAGAITAPSGGGVIDIEARNALAQLVENLQALGLIASPPA